MPTAAQFQDVTKTYRTPWRAGRSVQALRGVSFQIEPGEVFALLGPNRAGKTTLLKVFLGLCHPSSGRVFRLGRPLSERQPLAHIGYMHENQAFPRYLTAAALLQFYGDLGWVPAAVLKTRIPALLNRVGLADRAREPIGCFSKGMVQRLALARRCWPNPICLCWMSRSKDWTCPAASCSRGHRRAAPAGKTVLVVSHA